MNRHSVAVAYIDFQKAFDSVYHNKLLVRLASMGVAGNLLEWIKSFYPIVSSVLYGWQRSFWPSEHQ